MRYVTSLLLLVFLGAASAAAADSASLAPAERAAGFHLLFDGVSTAGWHLLKPESAKGRWVVKDGCLTPEGRPRELGTDAMYGNFDLRFEWKIAPGGNSGVLYRVAKGYHPPVSGPEYQILDNDRHPVRNLPERRAGADYGLYPPIREVCKPAGEWNSGRIVVQGNHVEHWLNGVKVVEYELHSADWRARVAKSKFAKRPEYGAARQGMIVLQDHGSPVWFRNIRIRELP